VPIEAIEVRLLRMPLVHPFVTSFGRTDSRLVALVRMDASGISGWGEIVAMEEAETQDPFAPFGTVKNPIRMMMMEHDTAGDILRELRAVTSDYQAPSDGCVSHQTLYQALEEFEKDLHQHIHLENNILFPKAVELENR